MDIKHTPFPPGIVMTAPGGLEWPRLGLVQGPNGELISTGPGHHTIVPGGHITVMPTGAINIPAATHVTKVPSSSNNTLPASVTMVPVTANQVTNTTANQTPDTNPTANNQIVTYKPVMKDSSTSTVSMPLVPQETTILITQPKYVCEICNKGFKSGYNLKRHHKDYHGENAELIKAKT
jgi:hypothetical protein